MKTNEKNQNFTNKILIQLLLIFIFTMVFTLIIAPKVSAKSYSINNMDFQTKILEDGSLDIIQKITYNFNGHYNGIYVNIPCKTEQINQNNILKYNRINNQLYDGDGIEIKTINLENNTNPLNYEINSIDSNKIKQIKIYEPSSNETKTFLLHYTIKNLCVSHVDTGELFYNFIGGKWDVPIDNLNIDIYLPNNQEELNIWAHGPYNGKSKIINNTHVNLTCNNIKANQYIAARVLFNNNNIPNCKKTSNISAINLIKQDEEEINNFRTEKNRYTKHVIIMAICLLIYWLILLQVYEKDKKYKPHNINEEELFKKYNPLIAGCIQGNRDILARDVIAVILNLINKKIVKFSFLPEESEDIEYSYYIEPNPESENSLDEIEKYIYNWIFKDETKINLIKKLEELPKDKDALIKLYTLNNMAKKELNSIGANKPKVPKAIKVFNIFLLILSIIISVKHILINGITLVYSNMPDDKIKFFILLATILPPFIIILISIISKILIKLKQKIENKIQKYNGQKITTKTIFVLILFSIIITISLFTINEHYIIIDELLLCIATIIVVTDNLMLKNEVSMIEDFSKLNALKYKLKEYTLLENKNYQDITLWEKYLSYGISFGIGKNIIKSIKDFNVNTNLNNDLTNLLYNNTKFTDYLYNDYNYFYSTVQTTYKNDPSLNYYSIPTSLKSSDDFASSFFLGSNDYSSSDFSSGSGGGFSGGGNDYSGGGGSGGGGGAF